MIRRTAGRAGTGFSMLLVVAVSFTSMACQTGPSRPDVLTIDGVPHRAVYRPCEACEKVGYFDKKCSICGGAGQKEIICLACFGSGKTTSAGTGTEACTVCKGNGKVQLPCPTMQKVKCRPCEGYGRVFVKYDPIEGADW